MKIPLVGLLALALVLSAPPSLADTWNVRRFDGRDYVSVAQIAKFYNLPDDTAPAEKNISLARGRRSLLVTLNSRAVVINGVKFILSFPVIEREGEYWLSRMDLGKTIEPAFRPELVPGIKPFTTVILDPGHGGRDKGASNRYELEKNFALDVSRRVRNELQKSGLRVFMTRNSDVFVELDERAALANARPKSIFVSIHFNSSPNRAANGLEIFCVTPRGAPSTEYDELLVRDMIHEDGNVCELQSLALAHAIYHALHGAGLKMFDRGVKRARFAVLRMTKMPSVLVEGGFLSNPADAKRIAAEDWRNRYAKAIATGILEYKNLAERHLAPRLAEDYLHARPGTTSAAALSSPTPAPASDIILHDFPH